ncbi:MAG: chromosomal replication initiator protein DnaA [Clostridiales bacterium]|jgi:chromosomal replication initiator protein|nr:chromosomal replication initiator protein DnaA [Clostridiales bacterium]
MYILTNEPEKEESPLLEEYWRAALRLTSGRFSAVIMETVISPMSLISARSGYFNVMAPSPFVKDTAEMRYGRILQDALQTVTRLPYSLRILSPEDDLAEAESGENEAPPPIHAHKKPQDKKNEVGLNEKYVFDSFVRGKSNELAYAASVAVADRPGETMYNPLFIYGGVGLGKTHLMQSIGNYVAGRDSSKKVLYTTTENFTNEFVSALVKNTNQNFRNKFREIDVFLIDDIQFLSDKEGIQEELFHTFNTIYDNNRQIVISSDQPPKDLRNIEDRLTSRFGKGLIVDITMPDIETRMAILTKKAELEGTPVPPEVINYIAQNVHSNIRELEGALAKIIALSLLMKKEITLDLARENMGEFARKEERREITIDGVIEAVSKHYKVSVEEIKGKKRTQTIVYPRQVAMYLCRKLADTQSLPLIGRAFGKDHSTVIHGCDKILGELEAGGGKLAATLAELEERIRGR